MPDWVDQVEAFDPTRMARRLKVIHAEARDGVSSQQTILACELRVGAPFRVEVPSNLG
jgi:hypothetical protein